MANQGDGAELKAWPDVVVVHPLIGKTTPGEASHWVKEKKKAVFFLFKTIHREGEKMDPRKSNNKFEDLCGYLRKDRGLGARIRSQDSGQGDAASVPVFTAGARRRGGGDPARPVPSAAGCAAGLCSRATSAPDLMFRSKPQLRNMQIPT